MPATRDVITDFQKALDDIDVSGIDANNRRGGDQSFRFIRTQDFRGREGELRYQTFDQAGASNDITVISGDINGDHVADFEIEIVGILQFTSGGTFCYERPSVGRTCSRTSAHGAGAQFGMFPPGSSQLPR